MHIKRKLALTALLFSCCFIGQAQQIANPLPTAKHGFIVIAHRGSHLVKPENTIAAIADAIEIGADYVEMDLRTTRDGHLVLLHNDKVDQVSSGKGRIRDLNFEEVKMLSLKGTDGSLHHIAGFEEALKICKGKINIYLDFKDADAAKTYQAIQKAGMEHQVLVYINKMDQYESWQKVAPQMPYMSSLDDQIQTKDELMKFLEKIPLSAIDNIPPAELLPFIKKLGISVFPDAQQANESSEDWKTLMKKGVQGMQTDHPGALIDYLKANGWRDGLDLR